MSINIESCYSFNGSIIEFDTLIQHAKKKEYQVLGLVDNSMTGAIKFYSACKKNDIKPVIGLSVKIQGLKNESNTAYVILYAKSEQGYFNLLKISSEIELGKKFTIQELKTYDDLITVLDTTKGETLSMLKDKDRDFEEKYADFFFKDHYIGIDISEYYYEVEVLPKLVKYSNLVVINKVKYFEKGDVVTVNILDSIIQNTPFNRDDLFFLETTDYSLKEKKEFLTSYHEYHSAVVNTKELIDKIDINLHFDKYLLPKYDTKGVASKDYLAKLCETGLKKRLKNKSVTNEKEYYDRLYYELNVINEMGFNDYFLIVYDFVLYAKKNNILVGPGRGSAAGSLVSYVLGIVDIDPLKYHLFFERFLNKERISMPDIDIDFPDNSREQVIKYVQEKYGKFHVANIATFSTFLAKSAIRDVARVLGIGTIKIEELLKRVENDKSLKSYFENNEKAYENYTKNDDEYKLLIDNAIKIESLPRHIGTHAAGVIISPVDLRDIASIRPVDNSDILQTQMEADDLKKIGLLKMDFLALKNLSIIEDILGMVKQNYGASLNIHDIPLDDELTFKLLQEKSTVGIFQLESKGMQKLIKDMKINSFLDISLCIALYRPGPMQNIPEYLKRRESGRITYLHPILKDILSDTLGIIVYQEQIMAIANRFAGYSLGEADVLRKAMSDKNASVLSAQKEKFIESAVKNGQQEKLAEEIFNQIEKFANYGFNKSHSVSYAMVAYWLAYLKAHYKTEFMISLLKNSSNLSAYLKECQSLGIKIHLPDVNLSQDNYFGIDDKLILPLKVVKNIGQAYSNSIILNRNEGYKSFIDFVNLNKNDVPKPVIESLIYVGAFDSFSLTRQTMINSLDSLYYVDYANNVEDYKYEITMMPEYDFDFLYQKELELLGFNLLYHPIKKHQNANYLHVSDIDELYQYKRVEMIGYLTNIKEITTKKKDKMMFVDIEDDFSTIDGVVFPSVYLNLSKKLIKHNCYLLTGKIDVKERLQIIIDDAKLLD